MTLHLDGPIGFLGFGNMGSAIAEGMLAEGITSADVLRAYDPEPVRMEAAARLGIAAAPDAATLAQSVDCLVLAVKPQVMESVLTPLRGAVCADTLVISIAAGIAIEGITKCLGSGMHVARVMPNTPALVRAGAAAYACSPNCTESDRALVAAMFGAVGLAVPVEEEQMDAVTALSGSGPAYFFRVVECMVDAAVEAGMEPGAAASLAGQTLMGAGRLLRESGETAAELRRKVTSKGGTTEAALNAFEAGGLAEVIRDGMEAAVRRSKELGA